MMNRPPLIPCILALLASGLTYTPLALAYLDPGTGSIMLQGLLAGIAGLAVVSKLYWHRIKQFFRRLLSSDKSKDPAHSNSTGQPAPDQEVEPAPPSDDKSDHNDHTQ